jgi:hypothetical protein
MGLVPAVGAARKAGVRQGLASSGNRRIRQAQVARIAGKGKPLRDCAAPAASSLAPCAILKSCGIHGWFSASGITGTLNSSLSGLMRKLLPLLLLIALAAAAPMAAPALAANTEDEVRRLVLAGEILPFDVIRDRVMAQVQGKFLGSDFDSGTLTYRLRFLVDGSVVNFDVDARTGYRLHKTRNY